MLDRGFFQSLFGAGLLNHGAVRFRIAPYRRVVSRPVGNGGGSRDGRSCRRLHPGQEIRRTFVLSELHLRILGDLIRQIRHVAGLLAIALLQMGLSLIHQVPNPMPNVFHSVRCGPLTRTRRSTGLGGSVFSPGVRLSSHCASFGDILQSGASPSQVFVGSPTFCSGQTGSRSRSRVEVLNRIAVLPSQIHLFTEFVVFAWRQTSPRMNTILATLQRVIRMLKIGHSQSDDDQARATDEPNNPTQGRFLLQVWR